MKKQDVVAALAAMAVCASVALAQSPQPRQAAPAASPAPRGAVQAPSPASVTAPAGAPAAAPNINANVGAGLQARPISEIAGVRRTISLFDPATQPINLAYYRDTKMRQQFEAMDLNRNGTIEWVAASSTFTASGAVAQLVPGPEAIAPVYDQCLQVQYKKNPPNTKNPSMPGQFLPVNEPTGWNTWSEQLRSTPRTCLATQQSDVWVCKKVVGVGQYIAENQQNPTCSSAGGPFGSAAVYTLVKEKQQTCTQYAYGVTRAAWDAMVTSHFTRQDFSGDGVLQPGSGPGSEREYFCLPK